MLRRTILPFDNRANAVVATKPSGQASATDFTWQALVRCSTEAARQTLDFNLAQRLMVLPLGLLQLGDTHLLTAAVPTGLTTEIERSLKFAVTFPTKLIEVPLDILERAIFAAYNRNSQMLLSATQQLQTRALPVATDKAVLPFRSAGGEIGDFLEKLIDYAISHEASDLHILPRSDGSYCRLRIKGELFSHQEPICNSAIHQQLLTRIKVLAGLDTTVRERPHDGLMRVPFARSEVTLRVSTMPTLHGEKVVLRFCGISGAQDLGELGLHKNIIALLENVLDRRRGTILMTGSTGSGKTTTMYAALKQLAQSPLNIVTIEDPIEILLPHATQTSINLKQGLDYPTALRSTLRQDPDAILIGEIRDRESAEVAMNAALSGHLILSTVHGRDVFEALLRLRLLGVDTLTLSQAVSLIICQRLVRRLCPLCKVFDLKGSNHAQQSLWRAVGCAQCDYTGFEGRQPIAEALLITPEIASVILSGRLAKADLSQILDETVYTSFDTTASAALAAGEILAQDYEVALG